MSTDIFVGKFAPREDGRATAILHTEKGHGGPPWFVVIIVAL